MKKRKLRIAVSGIGWCGCEHIKAFQSHPECEVALLHGRNRQRIEKNLAQYGVKNFRGRITTDENIIFRDRSIDVLSIAGVNSTHTPLAVAAAQSGKHLMIEKQVARDEAELSLLLDAVERSGVKTVVSFELYWNPLFQVARWLIESGRMGKVMFARSNYHSRMGSFYSGWDWCRTREEARSMLLNAGCHSVDALRQFLNDEPLAVSAFHATGIPQGYEYPSTIHANIRFADGKLGQVSASADVATPYHFGLEIFGAKLSLVNQFIRWPYEARVKVDDLQRACPLKGVRFFLEPYSESHAQIRVDCILPNSVNVDHHPFKDEVRTLVEAIRKNKETPIPLTRAAITHRICFAADRSAEMDGRAVPVA